MSSTSSTNEVNTAYGVSTANTQVSTASTQVSTANLSDDTVYAFLASQPNGSQLVHEDLEQIHEDDLEEMDLKWQYDKSKVECFNCHKLGHFARECRGPRNQDNKSRNQDSSRRTINVEEISSKAMLAIDGAGFCLELLWLMKKSLRSWESYLLFQTMRILLTRGLASVEEQLVFYKKNEVLFCEQLVVLKRDISYKDSEISVLKSELEKLKQEKESNQLKIENFDNASKIPPPPTGLFSPPNLDSSNSGLEEFQQPEFEGYGPKTSKSVSEDTSNEVRESPDASLIEELVSNNQLEKKTVFPTVAKINFVRSQQQEKPVRKPVKYTEMYRSQTPRGNQIKWNNQKSQQLGSDFVMYNKACFVCGSFDHVQANCNYHERERMISENNYTRVNYNYCAKKAHPRTHRNIVPIAVLMKTSLRPLNTARPVNTAYPKNTVYSSRPMSFNTTKGKVNTARPKVVNTARPNTTVVNVVRENQGHLQKEDQGYVDSGCSRHMTGNMFYLSDFKEFDGGYVTFGGGAKGGRITRKGTLKIGKLDFEDVLLKVPRKNNMYNVDMKNIVPKECLTCLVAKATLDESMQWHRRLGHVNFKTINKLVKDNLVKGLPIKCFENDKTCVACLKGKQHKASSSKDETSSILKSFITQIKNLVDKKVMIIRCDNETKFKNRVMSEFCEKKGIKREFSVARTPQQNGVAERRNRTLIEAARTISITPSLSFMKPFGCHVTILNTLDHLGKFDGKSDDGFFVGYSLNSKAFRVYNIRTRKVEENLHVRFLEDKLIIAGDGPKWLFDIDVLTKSMNYAPVVAGTNSNDFVSTKESIGADHSSKETVSSQDYILMPLWKDGSPFDSSSKDASNDEPQPSNDAGKKYDEGGIDDQERTENNAQDVNTVGPSINTANTNFNTGSLNINTVSPIVPTAPLESTYVDFFGDDSELDLSNIATTYPVPTTPNTRIYKDHSLDHVLGGAQEGNPSWIEAMQEELLQFKLQQVWTLVDLPYGKRAIGTKWVYKNKKDKRGIVIRNKARLMDVKSAFLYGKIEEEVYVCQPPGFEDPEFPDKVYKVEKALYGLHQAPRAWYETLSTYLLDNGFQRGQIDKTLFIKRIKSDILLVQVYVDDIIFGSTKKELCTDFEKLMHKKFQMSSMGELTFFLGLQVTQKDDGIFISQDKYVDEILKKFGFSTVKTASTPMETSKPLLKDAEAEDVDVHLYRSMIGSLMYLTYLLGLIECLLQTIVANSTTEVEYVAAASCYGQVLWIQNQMLDYGYNFMNIKILIDNERTICIVKNPVFHLKTKHIEIRHHFIRDLNKKKLIQMIKIHTNHNVADLLTKALDVRRFQYLIASIGMLNL
ncbi:putative ribonuclease H-like domain-containing protein [Tanacetum coccineum]